MDALAGRTSRLFASLRDVFAAQRDFLIDLDGGKVGDSDLGLTMNKAFAAASESVAGNVGDRAYRPARRNGDRQGGTVDHGHADGHRFHARRQGA